MGYSAVLLGLGVLVQDASPMSEEELRLVLGSCAVFADAGTAVLAAMRGRAERAPSLPAPDGGTGEGF
jgi:hypothetical protein